MICLTCENKIKVTIRDKNVMIRANIVIFFLFVSQFEWAYFVFPPLEIDTYLHVCNVVVLVLLLFSLCSGTGWMHRTAPPACVRSTMNEIKTNITNKQTNKHAVQVKLLQKHLRFLVNQLRRGAIIPREHTNLIRSHLRTWYGPGRSHVAFNRSLWSFFRVLHGRVSLLVGV